MTQPSSSLVSPGFAPAPASVGEARRFVTSTLDGWGTAGIEDAALLTSELATNAVIHAKSSYTVTIKLLADRVRIGVVDASPVAPRRCHYGATSSTGRGLGMVADLSEAWGVEPAQGGKCVWFEMSLVRPDTTAAADAVPMTDAGDVDLDALLSDLGGWEDDTASDSPRALLRTP